MSTEMTSSGKEEKREDGGRRAQDGRVTGIRLMAQQAEVLIVKNATLAWRNKAAFGVQIMATFIFILLIFGIDRALRNNDAQQTSRKNIANPARTTVPDIPDCSKQIYIQLPCLTFIYAPKGDPDVEKVVAAIMSSNSPAIPANRVQGFANSDAMDAYLFANKQTVSAGVEFFPKRDTTSALLGIDFGLQLNGTVKYVRGEFEDPNFYIQMPLQVAVERSIARYLYTNKFPNAQPTDLQWDIQTSEFAHPAVSPFSYVGVISPTFLLAAAMFTFVIQVSNVILEREMKLRESMRVMGLYDSMYWLSWLAWEVVVMNFISSIFIVCFGMIFQFDLFLRNSFGVLFFHFWLFELAMTGLGFFLSTFLAKANSGTFVGFIVFLFGFILMLIVSTGGLPFTTEWSGSDWRWLQYLFAMFPPTLLAKGLSDMGVATATDELKGITWSTRRSYCYEQVYFPQQNCDWSMQDIYGWFLVDFAVFMTLCLYFDNVNANEYGVKKNPLFFLMPSYWMGSSFLFRQQDVATVEAAGRAAGSELPNGLDDDVAAEENAVKGRLNAGNAELEPGVAVEVRGLVKSFGNFHAVRGNWFRIETGKLFALLGPNGAGKTTTINCLTGVLPVTAGNAVVYGQNVVGGGMATIRSQMGVCPQFDMLWGELTGREHLRIFAGIKGLPRHMWNDVAADLLDQTKLTSAADRRSSGYSGGMKRRLSVAVALIGDPAIVYLDEPTTGMDPISRRYVWDIVLAAKPGRAIVLTTHSMEEADVLADNVAIIAKGRLRCLGSSLRLKSKFGAGYRIAASVVPSVSASSALLSGMTEQVLAQRRGDLQRFFTSKLGQVPFEEGRVYTNFVVPRSAESKLAGFLSELRNARDQLHITDVQMSLTTLEEVFLTIAKEAERTAAAAEGRTGLVNVTVGTAVVPLLVPWGMEHAEVPGYPGEVVQIAWVQDDEGRLVYSHHDFRGVREINFIESSKGRKCCPCC